MYIYVTISRKRSLIIQNTYFFPVSKFKPPPCCAKILEDKTLNVPSGRQPKLPLSSKANEVETSTEIPLQVYVIDISIYLTMSSIFGCSSK